MEIERKFLIKKLPDNLESYEHAEIIQGYLNTEPVLRIRKHGDKYVFTYKGAGLMVREEYNLPLTKEAFEHLLPKTDGNIIRKMRYIIPLDDFGHSSHDGNSDHDKLSGHSNSSNHNSNGSHDDLSGHSSSSGHNTHDDHDDLSGHSSSSSHNSNGGHDDHSNHDSLSSHDNNGEHDSHNVHDSQSRYKKNTPGNTGGSDNDSFTPVVELDIFTSPKELIMAEVEFPDEETALSFTPPEWFGEDVTGNPAYHNSRMI